ncbi:MAG: prepilin peptidase [Deltaproteobacteria bacterium]|nr:prepilin peptidase [Deltaproteobacteria bacterium]
MISAHAFKIESILYIVLSVILLFSATTDLRSHRIPNYLTFPGMIAALTLYSFTNGFDGFLFSLKGIAVGIGVLLIPYLLGGMGAGDAKLMGAVGGYLGAKGVLGAFLLTAIIGGIYALLIIFFFKSQFKDYFKNFWQRCLIFLSTREYIPDPDDGRLKRPRLCYGLAIALGTGSYILVNFMGYHFIP